MNDILIHPQELRHVSEQLRTGAKKVGSALQAIDNDILSLKGDKFLGNRANAMQAHYAPKREALLKAKEIVAHFAEDLQEVADRFEKADLAKNSIYTKEGNRLVPFIGANGESDIHPNDVSQGGIGDCYLIAALGSLATQDPEAIRRLIHDNGDGTFTVTFYKKKLLGLGGYDEVKITVNRDDLTGSLPKGINSRANLGDVSGGSQEGWVAIIESAYAKWKGGYDKINGGHVWSPDHVLQELTGKETNTDVISLHGFDRLSKKFEDGCAITVASYQTARDTDFYKDGTLSTQHAYYVANVDEVNKTITINNPWGWDRQGNITLSFDDFRKNFEYVYYNPIN